MNPFRLVIIAGCASLLLGAGYMSWYGVGRVSGDLAAGAASASVRTGSAGTGTSGGYGFFGRVK